MSPLDRQLHRNPPTLSPYKILVDLGGFISGFFNFVGHSLVILIFRHLLRGRDAEAVRKQIVAYINFIVVCTLILWITFIILSIELIIPWNHISGAYSFDSGQWIILVTATCTLVRVLFKWQKLERLPKNE